MPTFSRPAPTRPAVWVLCALLVTLVGGAIPGCSCRVETPEERKARLAKEEIERLERERKQLEEARLRQPVVLGPIVSMPSRSNSPQEDEQSEPSDSIGVERVGSPIAPVFKPGHWTAIRQGARANAEDFDGLLTYRLPTPRSRSESSRVVTRRPLVVAKKSAKVVDSLVYVPVDGGKPLLEGTATDRRSGSLAAPQETTPARMLADHQYQFVVLAREPERYAYLDSLYAINSPIESRIEAPQKVGGSFGASRNYLVIPVRAAEAGADLALPDTLLAMTTVAYLLWDDVDPETLTPAQRDALVDWLNWGGQLIVSGPNSLDLLRGSFLEPLLPATSGGATSLDKDVLARLESQWSIGRKGKDLNTEKPWNGVELKATERGVPLPGLAGLVLERRVGRGRVVVTAFSLSEPRLLDWSRGVESFVNGALLRRPARVFVQRNDFGEPATRRPAVRWADGSPVRLDPWANTGVRLFIRDAHASPDQLVARVVTEEGFETLREPFVRGGLGAIHDFHAAAAKARETLGASAGVSVPGAGFVIACLTFYLIFLVPVNWGLFAALRRPELAWLAAPVIALVGAWVVIQQAQLDIGFVRSRTEVAVLELQPDTPRGLLTRFTALYTSLSTTYEAEFENPAVAQPFTNGDPGDAGKQQNVVYERLEKTRLKDLLVSSATTEFLRSEEMFDVSAAGIPGSSIPGSVQLNKDPAGGRRVTNRTTWKLLDTLVARRPDGQDGEPRLEGCWIGDLGPGEATNIIFYPIDLPEDGALPFPSERAQAAKLRREDEQLLDLAELQRLALDPKRFEPGESRVVARIPGVLPGVTITPAASQQVGETLLVGRLGYGPPELPARDKNGPLDIR